MRTHQFVPTAVLALTAPLLAVGATASAAPDLAAPAAPGVTFISFEDVPEVCAFAAASPLRGRYAAAKFKGPSATDGGAVLGNCASFGVAPRTGDRFLAFNENSSMSNGGTPRGPETIKLPTRQKKVVVWLSQGGYNLGDVTFKLSGKRSGKVIRKASSTTNTAAWTKLQIKNRKGFDLLKVVAVNDADKAWVLDDLTMWR